MTLPGMPAAQRPECLCPPCGVSGLSQGREVLTDTQGSERTAASKGNSWGGDCASRKCFSLQPLIPAQPSAASPGLRAAPQAIVSVLTEGPAVCPGPGRALEAVPGNRRPRLCPQAYNISFKRRGLLKTKQRNTGERKEK